MNRKEIVCYETDASRLAGRAEKVVFPKSAEEVREIIKSNSDIVPRGGGSGLVGGSIPNNSVVVDMSKMNRIFNLNPGRMTIYTEAGVTLRELNEKLRARGFEFPISLSNEGISTIGGMIATNASGRRGMRYGTMRDWTEEIEFVNGKGEIIKIGKADLSEVCGMEGITGIITSARLRIIPLMKRSLSVFQSESIDEILPIARKLKSEKEVVMLELFSPKVSELFDFKEKYNLFIEFDSDRGKIKGEDYISLSKKLDKSYYKLASESYYSIEELKFFFDKLGEFIAFLNSRDTPFIAYPGEGIIHSFFKDEEKDKIKEIKDFVKKTGTKFGRYGIGIKRREFLDSFDIKIIQRTKARHDSSGKINKGKIIDISDFKKMKEKKEIKHIPEIKPAEKEEIKEEEKESIFEYREKTVGPVFGEKPKQQESFDFDQIRKIMTNRYDESKKEEKAEINNQDKKPESSKDEERDLIKRKMTNKYKEWKNGN